MIRRLSLPSMIVVLAYAASSGASGEPFVARIDYAAPAGCPSERAFLNQVRKRAHHTRLATREEPAREFRAVITQSLGKFRARLEFVDPDGNRVSRELDGNRCDEVAAALELITALAIDPLLTDPTKSSSPSPAPVSTESLPGMSGAPTSASARPQDPSPGAVNQPTDGDLTARPSTDPGATRQDSSSAAARGSNATEPAKPQDAEPTKRNDIDAGSARNTANAGKVSPRISAPALDRREGDSRRWSPTLGAAIGVATDAAPDWAPNLSLFAGLAAPSRNATVRLEGSYAVSTSSSADSASSVHRLAVGALEGCPWAAKITQALRLWPCAALEAGLLRVEGRATQRWPLTNEVNTLWVAADAVLRAELDLSRYLALELGGKMRVPMRRNTFVYERPLVQAYETPAIGAVMYAGVHVKLGK